jgi:hypothetical protein
MRYGGVLQRRLRNLESTITLPHPQEIRKQIQVQALSRMSTEDLRVLRDIVQRQAAGLVVECNTENDAVIQRAEAIIAEVQAERPRPIRNARAAQ